MSKNSTKTTLIISLHFSLFFHTIIVESIITIIIMAMIIITMNPELIPAISGIYSKRVLHLQFHYFYTH